MSNDAYPDRYAQRVEAGLCGRCGQRQPEPGRRTCMSCCAQVTQATKLRATREGPGCSRCKTRAPEPGKRRCARCAEEANTSSRLAYRAAHGIAADAPIPRVKQVHTWQCSRCTEPHAPGSELCADHERRMAEFADEKRRGLWIGGEEDDGGDEEG